MVTVVVVPAVVAVMVVPAVVTVDEGPDVVAVPFGVLAGGPPVDGPPFPDGPDAAGGLVGAAVPGRVEDDAGVDVDVAGCTPEGGADAGPGELVAVVLEDAAPDGPTDGSGAGDTSSLAPCPHAAAIRISDAQPSDLSSRMASSIVPSSHRTKMNVLSR